VVHLTQKLVNEHGDGLSYFCCGVDRGQGGLTITLIAAYPDTR